MQTTTATLTIDEPLRTDAQVALYRARGSVEPARQFALAHAALLCGGERALIERHVQTLAGEPPSGLGAPLTRTERLRDATPPIAGARMGARSAFIPDLALKLKGCRPEPTTFPCWEIDDEYQVRIAQLPFGTLRAESVMREILGYCFLLDHGISPMSVPVAVMEYAEVESDGRFALVSSLNSDTRAETRLSCRGMTVHTLLRLHRSPRRGDALGGEVDLIGIDRARYVEAKSDLLMALNRGGGFRGILNSNIGNDVVDDANLVGLCDFDTFVVRPVPAAGDTRGIASFVGHAVLELLKTSLPFVDFLDLSGMTPEEAHRELILYYVSNSSLYRAYVKKLIRWTSTLGWDRGFVEHQIEAALSTPAACELLKELVPNSLTFSEFKLQSWYVAHG
jgi:hypothetical protein